MNIEEAIKILREEQNYLYNAGIKNDMTQAIKTVIDKIESN